MNSEPGFFNSLVKNAKNMFGNSRKNSKNNSRKNSTRNSTSYGFTSGPQTGGMAPIQYNILTQPSQAIMKWATTAGLPTPIHGMRNVAGGKRRTHRNKKYKKHKKQKTHRRK